MTTNTRRSMSNTNSNLPKEELEFRQVCYLYYIHFGLDDFTNISSPFLQLTPQKKAHESFVNMLLQIPRVSHEMACIFAGHPEYSSTSKLLHLLNDGDSLCDRDRDLLFQNAFHNNNSKKKIKKQTKLSRLIFRFLSSNLPEVLLDS